MTDRIAEIRKAIAAPLSEEDTSRSMLWDMAYDLLTALDDRDREIERLRAAAVGHSYGAELEAEDRHRAVDAAYRAGVEAMRALAAAECVLLDAEAEPFIKGGPFMAASAAILKLPSAGAPLAQARKQLNAEAGDEVSVCWADQGHSGPGWYAWFAEYPEEGAQLVDVGALPIPEPKR